MVQATPESDEAWFWALLAERYWERAAFTVAGCPLRLAVSGDELLRALRASMAHEGGERLARVSVSIDGRTVMRDSADFLPYSGDATLEAWLDRVDGQNRGSDWTVSGTGLHAVSAPFWDHGRYLARRVTEAVGARPPGRVDVDTFIGRYSSTNVGVHADGANNLGFTLRGTKQLLTWPPDADVPRRTSNYASARPSADVLVGQPGNVTYFPAPQLHVGESPDEVTVSVNVAFFVHADPVARVLDVVSAAVREAAGDVMYPAPGEALPNELERILDSVVAVAASESTREYLTTSWLREVTSFGLAVARPTEVVSRLPSPDQSFRIAKDTLLMHIALPERRVFAANGHIGQLPPVPGVDVALDLLAAGRVANSRELAAAMDASHSDKDAETIVRALLYRLATWGALECLPEDAR